MGYLVVGSKNVFDASVLFEGFVVGAIAAIIGAIIQLLVTSMTLQDNLDSKSGWREKLFNVASKDKIELKDVYTLRTTLRLDPKDYTISILNNIAIHIVSIAFKLGFLSIVFSDSVSQNDKIEKSLIIVVLYYLGLKLFDILFFRKWLSGLDRMKTKNFFHEENLKIEEYNFDSMTKTIIFYCDLIFDKTIDLNNPNVQKNIRIICRYMLKHHWEYLSVPSYRFLKKLQIALDDRETIHKTVEQLKINHYMTSD